MGLCLNELNYTLEQILIFALWKFQVNENKKDPIKMRRIKIRLE